MSDVIDLTNVIRNPNKNTIPAPNQDRSNLDEFIEMAKEVADSNEDIESIRKSMERSDEERLSLETEDAIPMENLPEGVTAATREFSMDASGKPIFVKEAEELPAAPIAIDKIDELDQFNDTEFKRNFMSTTKSMYNISDDSAIGLIDVMMAYRRDKSINVYDKLPDEIKKQVQNICMSANAPATSRNAIAKAILDQMIAETATDQTFIDFEKSLNEAMRIPSLVDLYEEHMNDTMNIKLPAMADAIEKEDPEKAKLLREIAVRYDWARDYSKLQEVYDTNTRIRRSVRKEYDKWRKFAEELNYANRDSKFRMPDATTLQIILVKHIANDDSCDITEDQVNKFLTLLYRSCEELNNYDILDAAYMYYLLKNITMMSYVNDDSSQIADSFSAELISNIKALIYYISAKEEEFHASNQPRKRKAKR